MKLNRSAIILAIAIILLIVALFAVRCSNEGDDTEFITNASNASATGNATNATFAANNATIPTDNATSERPANATSNATGNAAGNATGPNATLQGPANATAEITEANATAEQDRLAKEKEEKAAKEKKEKAAKEKAAKEKKEKKEKAAKEKAEQEKLAQAAQPTISGQSGQSGQSGGIVVAPTAPATPKSSSAGAKPSKNNPPSDSIISQLNDFGSRRVSLINSSIRPSKSSREITKEGNEYVSRYYYVSPTSLRCEATQADSSAPFIYVGKVRYQECLYEHRAPSREEAMRGEGQVVKSRNMLELIRYTNKWTE